MIVDEANRESTITLLKRISYVIDNRGYSNEIKQIAQLSGGALRVLFEVLYRAKARVLSVDESDGCFTAVADVLPTKHADAVLEEAYFRTAKELVKEDYIAKSK